MCQDLRGLTFPVENGNRDVVAVGAFAGSFETWAPEAGSDVSGTALLDFLRPSSDIALFVVPVVALAQRPLDVRVAGAFSRLTVVEIDEPGHYAVMSATVAGDAWSAFDSSLVWANRAMAVPVDEPLLVVSGDPTKQSSAGFVLTFGRREAASTGGEIEGMVTGPALGTPVASFDGELVGFVEVAGGSMTRFVAAGRVASTLLAVGSAHAPATASTATLGASVVTTEVARLGGTYDGRAVGALVGGLVAQGPAQHSGLRSGDVVVGYDDEPIPSSSALVAAVRADSINSTHTLSVVSLSGTTRSVTVELGARR